MRSLLISLVASLSVLFITFDSNVVDSRRVYYYNCVTKDGIFVTRGESIKIDDCTTCSCPKYNKIKSCAPICETEQCPAPISWCPEEKVDGVCCPVCTKCKGPDNQLLNVGDTNKRIGCKKCTCEEAGSEAICSPVKCSKLPSWCPGVKIEGKCCPECNKCRDPNGKLLKKGAKIRRGCKVCFCKKPGTNTICKPLRCRSIPDWCTSVAKKGKCCTNCRHCLAPNGELIKFRYKSLIDKDTICSCKRAGTKAVCEKIEEKCDENFPSWCPKETVEGKICPVCKKCRTPDGNLIDEGSKSVKVDKCTTCSCVKGGNDADCDKTECPPLPSWCPLTEITDKCCPICEKCRKPDGGLIDQDPSPQNIDPCTTCTCTKGGVDASCEITQCPSISSWCPPVKTKDDCCAVCRSCLAPDGTVIPFGSEPTSINVCTKCVCDKPGKKATCEKEQCPGLPKWCPKLFLPDQCCPECQNCLGPGERLIPEGAKRFKTSACTNCSCPSAGVEATCNDQKCDPLPSWCPPQYKPDQCCAECRNCLLPNGGLLHLKEKKQIDPCTKCQCRVAGLDATCKETVCEEIPPWCKPIHIAGKCCPVCKSCRAVDDSVIDIGETKIIDKCLQCTCKKGGANAECKGKQCPDTPDWCKPIELKDKCCPICDTCLAPDGSTIKEGQTSIKIDDCTTCDCIKGGSDAICETKKCPKLPKWCPPKEIFGKCCPICISCLAPDNTVLLKSKLLTKIDDCTTCKCFVAGQDAVCDTEKCPKHPSWCPKDFIPGKCCPVCKRCLAPNNKLILEGDLTAKIDECTKCICKAGEGGHKAKCTSEKCPLTPKWCHALTTYGNCCPECRECLVPIDGRILPVGTNNLRINDCSVCSCLTGGEEAVCETELCPALPHWCPPHPVDNQCCPVCQSCRTSDFKLISEGTYGYKVDECVTCNCPKGGFDANCDVEKCRPLPDWCKAWTPKGECCPVCESCLAPDGTLIPEGKENKKLDDCTTCSCEEGGYLAECISENCAPIPYWCTPQKTNGACCPKCNSCQTPTGVQIPYGLKQIKLDDCISCSCLIPGTDALCNIQDCPQLPYWCSPTKVFGKCCPRCESCRAPGNVFIPTATYNMKINECTTCSCPTGGMDAKCNIEECKQLPYWCPPKKRSGECCPKCDQCLLPDGKLIPSGTFNKEVARCTVCSCLWGGEKANCHTEECPKLPPWCPPKKINGRCCPVCDSCLTKGGDLIKEGSHLKMLDPCTRCSCPVGKGGNEAYCDVEKCSPIPTWCPPVKVDGECCSLCLSCQGRNNDLIPVGTYGLKIDECTSCSCPVAGIAAICNTEKCQTIPDWCLAKKGRGQCCSECKSCRSPNGKLIPEGLLAWQIDECTKCSCPEGGGGSEAHCHSTKCPSFAEWCPAKRLPGECCPTCEKCQLPDGSLMSVGRRLKLANCVICNCKSGGIKATCEPEKCPEIPSWCFAKKDEYSCCPECKSCKAPNGKIIPESPNAVKIDECTSCTCFNGGKDANCVVESCKEIPEWCAPTTIHGKCCPVCEYCRDSYNRPIPLGTSGKKVDECTRCSCREGGTNAICDTEKCNQLPDWCPGEKVHGQCCPVCKKCRAPDGTMVPEGAISMHVNCRLCSCAAGGNDAACLKEPCPPVPHWCPPETVYGDCCPVCKSCRAPDGTIMYEGDEHKTDVCRTCHCFAGGLNPQCHEELCQPCVSGSHAVPVEGECCPVCQLSDPQYYE